MRLRLPAGYESRGDAIARAVVAAAAQVLPAESRRFDKLPLGPIRVAAEATDADVAGAVARRLGGALRRKP